MSSACWTASGASMPASSSPCSAWRRTSRFSPAGWTAAAGCRRPEACRPGRAQCALAPDGTARGAAPREDRRAARAQLPPHRGRAALPAGRDHSRSRRLRRARKVRCRPHVLRQARGARPGAPRRSGEHGEPRHGQRHRALLRVEPAGGPCHLERDRPRDVPPRARRRK